MLLERRCGKRSAFGGIAGICALQLRRRCECATIRIPHSRCAVALWKDACNAVFRGFFNEKGRLCTSPLVRERQRGSRQVIVLLATFERSLSTPPATALTAKYHVAGERLPST